MLFFFQKKNILSDSKGTKHIPIDRMNEQTRRRMSDNVDMK